LLDYEVSFFISTTERPCHQTSWLLYHDLHLHRSVPPLNATLAQGELCLVIKKDGKNIPESEADDYILGYTVGNDISSRYWQRPPYSGGQYCYAKGFDKFAPIGPTIRATAKSDFSNLMLRTLVNENQRQITSTGDLIYNPRQIVAHVSKGCTLRKGTVVMTGTPSGIAGRQNPPLWLKKNDFITVSISGIGSIRNKLVGF
jgi:2-keto-4-pentenoate hydratase/2-oxohepta-3-ene-1,7-dioic acid hydratase in catechol pathway